MGKLLSLIEKFKAFNVTEVGEAAINETAASLSERQQEQLFDGTRSDGGNLSTYKSRAYATKKNQMNPKPGFGNPDLKLSGDFYRGISAVAQDGRVIIRSSDAKAPFLEKRYGADEIFGLTGARKKQYIDGALRPAYLGKIKQIFRL